MANSTLAAIRTKIRRLTRSPSDSILTNDDIDEYVNTFILYDMPEHLRLFSLRTTFTFYTEPYIDLYETNTVDAASPLYHFKDLYVTAHAPIYIGGNQAMFTQSRAQFYNIFPIVNSVSLIATGDGVTTNFAGTLSSIPVLRNQVLFSSVDVNNGGLALYDDGDEGLIGNGGGDINYITGVYNLNFANAPGVNKSIYSQTVPYSAAIPTALLYFENKFYLRPVPDQPYRVDIEVYKMPTDLILTTDSPDLKQWWQYIAYGAAKKVLEDRIDIDSINRIMPEFKQQELLVLRKTIVQQSNERVATIYTEHARFPNNDYGVF